MEVKKLIVLWMLSLSMFVFSCQKGDNKEAFYGKGSKTWRVAKETNAAGKKEKLSDEEKQDILRFNSDGSFSANTHREMQKVTGIMIRQQSNLLCSLQVLLLQKRTV
jgi:hypothetical protein